MVATEDVLDPNIIGVVLIGFAKVKLELSTVESMELVLIVLDCAFSASTEFGKLNDTRLGDFIIEGLGVEIIGVTAEVEIGDILTFVVIVRELSVAHTSCDEVVDTGGFISSAFITTSGLNLLDARKSLI